jgi:diguanylate cyclase (GGDEF)-like protein
MKDCNQIVESINIGIILIDRHYNIAEWNSWMVMHSGLEKSDVINTSLFRIFPELEENQSFRRGCRSVFTFGNLAFMSAKLHGYVIPFRLRGQFSDKFSFMQQNCYMLPIKDDEGNISSVMINIHDVTENAVLEKNLKELSYVDGLTGAYNRRTFEKRLSEEFNRHQRTGKVISLIMFDIDHFKSVNDKYGHQTGDFVLQEIVKICKSKLRTEDLLARYGGEEFVCLLIDQNVQQAVLAAERLRTAIEESVITDADVSFGVTVSLGAADSGLCANEADLLKKADDALYKAKNSGRNKTFPTSGLSSP